MIEAGTLTAWQMSWLGTAASAAPEHFATVSSGTPRGVQRLMRRSISRGCMRTVTVENQTGYDWRRDGWLGACALTAVLLIVSAATPHAAGFDTFLRAFVFSLALVRGFAGFRRGGAWLPLSAAVIAILFNPARPIEMGRVGSLSWSFMTFLHSNGGFNASTVGSFDGRRRNSFPTAALVCSI